MQMFWKIFEKNGFCWRMMKKRKKFKNVKFLGGHCLNFENQQIGTQIVMAFKEYILKITNFKKFFLWNLLIYVVTFKKGKNWFKKLSV
jgi:hypothetical protein